MKRTIRFVEKVDQSKLRKPSPPMFSSGPVRIPRVVSTVEPPLKVRGNDERSRPPELRECKFMKLL